MSLKIVENAPPLSKLTVDYAKQLKYQIISVGSGTGRIEKMLMDNGVSDIICVDPDPQSFDNTEIVIKPHYSTVNQLIIKHPELVGNCSLMLIWSTPVESTYDYDAIVKLQPNDIFIQYESIGAAGGNKLHKFMKSIGLPNSFEFDKSITIDNLTNYKSIYSKYCTRDSITNLEYVNAFITKEDLPSLPSGELNPKMLHINREHFFRDAICIIS